MKEMVVVSCPFDEKWKIGEVEPSK